MSFDLSRRSLLAIGAGLGLTGMTGWRNEPDLILHHGRIATLSDHMPEAEALAIGDGRIMAVGANDDILAMAGPHCRKVDLAGQRVTPGINDAHSHPIRSGMLHLRQVACDKNSVAAVKQAIAARAAQTPPGQWVLGFLYDDAKTERPITRADLDEAAPDNPVFVKHRGGHTAFVNSMAFRLAGIDETTPNPEHGEFFREGGRLNGRMAEKAQAVFAPFTNFQATPDDYRAGAAFISRYLAERGITSVCDASGGSLAMRGAAAALADGRFQTRLYVHFFGTEIEKAIDAGLRTGIGNDWIKTGALKLLADGSISERTAWLAEPYIGLGDFHGISNISEEECYRLARLAHDAGWQIGIHGNGELAIDRVLTVFERLQKDAPRRDPRFRIEHCTVVDADLVRRIRALNAIPVLFGGYVYFYGPIMKYYGEKRLERMFALRSMLDAGIVATSSSDYTASPADPGMWFRSEVTRTDYQGHVWGASQRVSLMEALRSSTVAGAYASFEEREKGRLEPGMLADLVVWQQDMFAMPADELTALKPERTMVGGQWSYEA